MKGKLPLPDDLSICNNLPLLIEKGRKLRDKGVLEPCEEGGLIYICWKAGSTVDKPVVAGTIAINTKGRGLPHVPQPWSQGRRHLSCGGFSVKKS